MTAEVIIVGGGAAGLFCAMTAAQAGRRVRVIEHARQVGRKILMSGGGRCNFTNLYCGPDNFLSANPHFCKSALARFSPYDFLELVERHDIAWHEKELGQLFCDESSRQIVTMLLSECAAAGVEIRTGCEVASVDTTADGFMLDTGQGPMTCERLVIASGGLSIPKMGASGFGYEIARQFGHGIIETRAALVPLTLSGAPLQALSELAGVAQQVTVSCDRQSFSGALLITHRGLSGPAILQISSYWQPGQDILVDWLPGLDAEALMLKAKREQPRQELANLLAEHMPRRLAQHLCAEAGLSGVMTELADARLREFAATLRSWRFRPSGTEGYRTAEVTLGGIATDEVSSRSFESARQSGLYFIGEVLDVTGHLGGYNFQWAWASARAAGLAL